ncbi:hypothetical protein BCU30_018310 [Vibrio lentus]|uniref:hypothetical protein n=1 Tax=Vibrio lentus TaxID=136468 RepID=UPI000C851C25|nr:hypothetical protein [Vibrio lentus]PMG23156.1 hypothetical protein BCU96_13990 [Vibrio lentus]PMH13342.1 hypothetical protein BCU76_22135 [Vibrio lentus]PMJ12965.1 hypothetical protein BCU30_12715 [Vibrio lentus]PMK95626.1 hypothetical protein BCT89_13910 [Vibrio lentus]PML48207.1 hypothetical protein BCT75_20665 [Vibrio lentus]
MGNNTLFAILVVIVVGIFAALIGNELGYDHPLTLYAAGGFIALIFFIIGDGKKDFKGTSIGVWLALITNVIWLTITFFLLPSLDVITATKGIDNQTMFSVLWDSYR